MIQNTKFGNQSDDQRREVFLLVITIVFGAAYAITIMATGNRAPYEISDAHITFASIFSWGFFLASIAHLFSQGKRFLNSRKDDDYGWGGFSQIFIADFLFILACSSIYWVLWAYDPDKHFSGFSSADGCGYVAYRFIGVALLIAQGVGFGGIVSSSADCEFIAGVLTWFSKIIASTTLSFGIAFVVDRKNK